MAKIIRDGGIIDDPWRLLNAGVDEAYQASVDQIASESLIIPLALWRQWSPGFGACDPVPGVSIDGSQDLDAIADLISLVPVIAVNFPAFVDGSGFSVGTLLREVYGFEGELRAFGELILDQVPYLRRCGFNVIALADEQQLDLALKLLIDGGLTYQGTVFSPRTPFRFRYGSHSHDIEREKIQ